MKKYFILFYIFFFINLANAESIAYIDMEKIINNSVAGEYIKKEIQKNVDIKNKKLDQIAKDLKKEEQDLINKKNILSKDEFSKKISQLKKKVSDYQNNRNESQTEIKKMRVTYTNNLLKRINPIIANYASEKNITIVLRKQQIVMGKTNLDISNDILEIVNKEIKNIKLN